MHHHNKTSCPTEINLADDDIKMGQAASKLSPFRLAHLTSLRKFINEAGDRSINGGPLDFALPKGDDNPNVLATAISSGSEDRTCKSN